MKWAKAHFFVGPSLLGTMSSAIISKIEAIAERVGQSEGIEIVEVELKGGGQNRFLRISIDRPEGVTHADCELISQQVGTILDVEDVVPGKYTLEVSSPGVERKLSKYKDFERFQGKKIVANLKEPVENSRRWEGTLASCADGLISLEVAQGKTIQFPFDQVEKANLKFEWGTRTN
jgi:ribosome maturation factor RimP